MRGWTIGALALLTLAGCSGPSLEAFNDRGGVISYHMVNSSMADVLAVAENYSWSQSDLAAEADVSEKAIWDFESEARTPRASTIDKIEKALQRAGVEFMRRTLGARG